MTGGAGATGDRVFVLGAGRAGRGLAAALDAAGVGLAGLHGRRADPAARPAVTAGPLPPALADATVVLVAVQDAALDAALAELLAAGPRAGAVVLHASGGTDPVALDEVRGRGHPAGTFHPLLPLADPAHAPALLRGAWVGVDGDGGARAAAARLARAVGASVLDIPDGAKARYHAAAVFASNFPTVLAAVAERLMTGAGVDAAAARGAVRTLLAAAAENVRHAAPSEAITGPVARGDAATVRRHLEALRDAGDEWEATALYYALTVAALGLTDGRRPAGADAAFDALVDAWPGEFFPVPPAPAGGTAGA